jgi:predicted nucleotidyltransferase
VIDPHLTASLDRLVERFRSDPRCTAMYLWGSLGRADPDPYSDVDVAVVTPDSAYEEVARELRGVVEAECGPVVAWLPEGEAPGFCNYAFLYEAPDRVLLYDFVIVSESAFRKRQIVPGQVLFSHGEPGEAPAAAPGVQTPPPLVRLLTEYWVYMYLNGKYWRRGDLYKLLYVQQVLFQTHLKVLATRYPDREWTWWARDVKHLPPEAREELLAYFPGSSRDAVASAIAHECDLFSRDAASACGKAGQPYPAEMEAAVRRHLRQAGILDA